MSEFIPTLFMLQNRERLITNLSLKIVDLFSSDLRISQMIVDFKISAVILIYTASGRCLVFLLLANEV